MKYTTIVITVLILLGNPKAFSQSSSIKGKFIEYETSNVIPGVTMVFHTYSGKEYEAYNNVNGNFEVKIGDEPGDLIVRFVGCYTIKIRNIPQGPKHLDFGEIRMVQNYGRPQFNWDGSAAEIPKELIEKDKNMRNDVLKNYRIKVLDKKLKPYFDGVDREHQYIVFDFKNGE